MTISHRRRTKIVWAAKAWVATLAGPTAGDRQKGRSYGAQGGIHRHGRDHCLDRQGSPRHIPLIEPDRQISRIRLSDKTSRFACNAICSFRAAGRLAARGHLLFLRRADGAAIRAFTSVGAKGIVLAAFASGMVTPGELEAIKAAVEAGVTVVVSTRAGSGVALDSARLRPMGVLSADNLNPQKARLLLALALTVTREPDEIRRIFATY
jgi:hypothetical protein